MYNKDISLVHVPLIECVNKKTDKWHIRWGFIPLEDSEGFNFKYRAVNQKPTISEVKEIVLSCMNSEIDKKIVEGYEWAGMKVWLSSENQFNYKAAYDLAVQTGGANLPVKFKFGTTEEPIYHEFKTVEELSSFYMGVMNYINETLNEGWREKDAVDWTPYEDLLK